MKVVPEAYPVLPPMRSLLSLKVRETMFDRPRDPGT